MGFTVNFLLETTNPHTLQRILEDLFLGFVTHLGDRQGAERSLSTPCCIVYPEPMAPSAITGATMDRKVMIVSSIQSSRNRSGCFMKEPPMCRWRPRDMVASRLPPCLVYQFAGRSLTHQTRATRSFGSEIVCRGIFAESIHQELYFFLSAPMPTLSPF
jgi:hypothetical protein